MKSFPPVIFFEMRFAHIFVHFDHNKSSHALNYFGFDKYVLKKKKNRRHISHSNNSPGTLLSEHRIHALMKDFFTKECFAVFQDPKKCNSEVAVGRGSIVRVLILIEV